MAYLIDTNIAIHARDGTGAVLDRLALHEGRVLLSALSLAELQRGLYREPALTALRQIRLSALLESIPVVLFNGAAAEAYGRIIVHCGWVKGRDFDRMIAGHAIATASVLVTDNISDFRDIPALQLENWAVR